MKLMSFRPPSGGVTRRWEAMPRSARVIGRTIASSARLGSALVETVIGENQTRPLATLFTANDRVEAGVPNFAAGRVRDGRAHSPANPSIRVLSHSCPFLPFGKLLLPRLRVGRQPDIGLIQLTKKRIAPVLLNSGFPWWCSCRNHAIMPRFCERNSILFCSL